MHYQYQKFGNQISLRFDEQSQIQFYPNEKQNLNDLTKTIQNQAFLQQLEKKSDDTKLKKQYYNFFKDFIPDPQNYIPNLPSDQQFKRHKIKYLKGNKLFQNLHSYHYPYIRVKRIKRQGSIVNYIVIIAIFELEITLLNIDQDANIQKNKIGSGSYGSVRIESLNKRMFAVKRQVFQNKVNLREFNMMANKQEIDNALIQLAIYKICSLLKIGPAAETDIGFDLICYRNCIEFQIQYCMKIQQGLKHDQKRRIYVYKNKFEKQIKQCLLTLHFYRIIHKDIKPANILFSIKYNKYVFTDFGISHPVIEKIGYRSKTFLQGTYNYISDQMKKIDIGQTGYVDLYGNDIYSLSVALKQKMINQNIQRCKKLFNYTQQYYNITYEYEYLKLKYYCIKPNSKMQQVQIYWKFMNKNRLTELIEIVNKSIEYDKIKKVYNYLSKFEEFKDMNLDSLRIQSSSIKQLNIDPNLKQTTELELKNNFRIYGYNEKVKDIIIKLELQSNYKQTLRMIDIILDTDNKIDHRDLILENYRNYIIKINKEIANLKQKQNQQEIYKRYMIILKYGNITEQLETIQKLNKIKYNRKKEQRIVEIIRVTNIEKKKDKIQKFLQQMNQQDTQLEKILKQQKLQNQVAIIYQDLGQFEKALFYYNKSLKLSIQLYGQQHPNVATIYSHIASVYRTMGKYQTALIYFNKSLKNYLSFHGQQHPNIATIYNNIAIVYNSRGKTELAIAYFTKSLNMDISFYGQNHPNIARTYNNIASVYNKIGKYEISLTYYNKSFNIYIAFYGQHHPSIATIYNNMAIVYDRINKYEPALKYYNKSLNMHQSFYGQKHPNIAKTYNNIASVYNKKGDYENALVYYTKSINMEKSFHGQQHPNIAITYNNIASVYNKIGNYEIALQYYTKSLNMFISLYGQQHYTIAAIYNNIAFNYFPLGNLKSAKKYFYKSTKLLLNLSMMNSTLLVANNYQLLSQIFLSQIKNMKSLHYAHFALDTFLKFNPIQHPQSPNYISLLAKIYYERNRFIQSYFFYRLSCQILVRYFPIHHTNVRNTKYMMNEMEWSMPQSIYNYTSNIQFMNHINSKYSQLSNHKLMKLLFAKKWQLRFEYQYRSRRKSVEYLKCVIEIYLCYKYLGYLKEKKKIGESVKEELQRFVQSQQKSMFREFIKEISLEQ